MLKGFRSSRILHNAFACMGAHPPLFVKGADTTLCQSHFVRLVIWLGIWLYQVIEFIDPFASSWPLWIVEFLELCLTARRSCRNFFDFSIIPSCIHINLVQDGVETHLFITNPGSLQSPSTILSVWKNVRVCCSNTWISFYREWIAWAPTCWPGTCRFHICPATCRPGRHRS